MYYDLDTLEELSNELGFITTRISIDTLEVKIYNDIVLVFSNLPDEDDTLMGFKGTPWHGHYKMTFMTSKGAYVEFDELDIVQRIKDGDLLINEMYIYNELKDRWLSHKEEGVDLKYMEPGEEIRIHRVA